jgi:hypothetical protein
LHGRRRRKLNRPGEWAVTERRMTYLESQGNCITKRLDDAWIRLESLVGSECGEMADELFCSALGWEEKLGDGEELLHLLYDYIKRIEDRCDYMERVDSQNMEDFEKSLTPSDRRRLAQINEANRQAAREAKARGEDNFLIRAYLRKEANPWMDHCNSREVSHTHRLTLPRAREHSSPAKPNVSGNIPKSGGGDSDDGDSDCSDPPEPPYPVTSPLTRSKQPDSIPHLWRRPGCWPVPGRGLAA